MTARKKNGMIIKKRSAVILIPNDPVILLSFVNTKLRDFYPTLSELCADLQIDQNWLINKLAAIDYEYNAEQNRFV